MEQQLIVRQIVFNCFCFYFTRRLPLESLNLNSHRYPPLISIIFHIRVVMTQCSVHYNGCGLISVNGIMAILFSVS